jgi:hypothetical protein
MVQLVQIPDDLLREADRAAREAGFSTTDEFISWAVADKVRELRQAVFEEVTDRVREGLSERGLTPEEVLEDFEQFRQA